MISLFAAIALLIFAGVVGLVAMVIALYAVSVAFDAESRRTCKRKDLNIEENETHRTKLY